MSRNKWVEIEPQQVIESPHRKKQVNLKKRLKRENAAIDKHLLEQRKTWVFVPPANMTVTLHHHVGSVPAGLVLSVPHAVGAYILLKRLGRIMERSDVVVDAVIEGEYEDAVEALGAAL